MYKDLRQQAEKKVQAKTAFYICATVFFFVSIVLLMLSYSIPSISAWLRLPIPIFAMVIGILYIYTFGFPGSDTDSEDWREDEIEKEMVKLLRQRKDDLNLVEESDEEDNLELKAIEILKERER